MTARVRPYIHISYNWCICCWK